MVRVFLWRKGAQERERRWAYFDVSRGNVTNNVVVIIHHSKGRDTGGVEEKQSLAERPVTATDP